MDFLLDYNSDFINAFLNNKINLNNKLIDLKLEIINLTNNEVDFKKNSKNLFNLKDYNNKFFKLNNKNSLIYIIKKIIYLNFITY